MFASTLSPLLVLVILVAYGVLLHVVGRVTAGGWRFGWRAAPFTGAAVGSATGEPSADTSGDGFFLAERRSRWYVVAFGMIGTSLSGVTFVSVPGLVGVQGFSYLQMVLGYVPGYAVIALVLLPLYYRMQLVSIYGYLDERFGSASGRTGALFFLLSRGLGVAARLYLVVKVLQWLVFDAWGVPFLVTAAGMVAIIWSYTRRGGVRTVLWTDTLLTGCLLLALFGTVWVLGNSLAGSPLAALRQVAASDYSHAFNFTNAAAPTYFWKQFLGGMFIAIAMTGLDQDMMQKNLTCRSLPEAQRNVLWFTVALVGVNLLFLTLGALLYLYAGTHGLVPPAQPDQMYPWLATHAGVPLVVGLLFVLGMVAVAYSSADSALAALTTSVCVDLLRIRARRTAQQEPLRRRVHVFVSLALVAVMAVFQVVGSASVIQLVFALATYTYGPLLGLFAYGLFTRNAVHDRWVPVVAVLSPLLTFLLDRHSAAWFWGYHFGFELLLLNGAITFLGLLARRKPLARRV